MNATHRKTAVAAGLLIGAALSSLPSVSVGQSRRPPPPPPQPRQAQPDQAAFAKAYQTAGEPRVLVLVGQDVRSGAVTTGIGGGSAGSGAATRTTSGGNDADGKPTTQGVTTLTDDGGDASALCVHIENHLLRADVRVVNLDALTEKDVRDVRLAEQRGNGDSLIALLGAKTNADVVLSIRMLGGDEVQRRGANYRVSVEAINVGAGRKICGFTFDWRQGVSSEEIAAYADAVTRKFYAQYASFYDRPAAAAATYIVRLIGVDDAREVRKIRDIAKKIRGVKKVFDGELSTGDRAAMSTMEIRYEGSPLDLTADLQDAFGKELGMVVSSIDASSGSITLAGRTQKPRGIGEVLMDGNDPGFPAAAAAFRKMYAAKGSPKIAVIVNRELSDADELADPSLKEEIAKLRAEIALRTGKPAGSGRTAPDALLAVNLNKPSSAGAVASSDDYTPPSRDERASPERRDTEKKEQSINNRRVENKIFTRLVKLGVQVVDPEVAREKLKARQDKEARIFNEQEIVFLLGRAAETDMVISGVGRVEDRQVVFTFRVVRTSSGAVVAAEDVAVPFVPTYEELEAASEEAASRAVGSLAEQMQRYWAPPNRLTVTIKNAANPREVSAIMSFFKDNIPGVSGVAFESHEAGQGTGVGIFSIEYSSTYEELLKQITEMSNGKLPFDLDAGENRRDTMTITIKKAG